MDNKLSIIIKEQGIEADKAQSLIEAFGAPFTEAGDIIRTYQDIKVTDESQVDLMLEARDKRLALKRIRTGVESTRKDLKEDYLRAGKAIDSVARYIKETIEPAEKYLELQENFIELRQAERAAQRLADRAAALAKYCDNLSIYNFAEIDDATFEALLAKVKGEFEAKLAAEAAEQERLKKEAEDAEIERQRIVAENAKLKAEADERIKAEAEAQAKRDAAQAEAKAIQDKIDAEAKAKLDAANAERDAAIKEAELKAAAAEKLVNDARIAAEAEAKAKADAEAKAKAEADEAERKAMLAPDKDKLIAFTPKIAALLKELPAVSSKAAREIVILIESKLEALDATLNEQIRSL